MAAGRPARGVTAARVVLLGIAVSGALMRPWRLPSFVAPLVCAVVAVAADLVSLRGASHALRPLGSPLAFLLAAIPLAVLLDRFGYFETLANRFGSGRLLLPGLWLLALGTVAVLNLDAAVVLLTPLYLRIARRQGRSPRYLGFQPVILALLASSFLPVSNLTNLIAAARFRIAPWQLLEHLGLPGLVACGLGYLLYRLSARSDLFDPQLDQEAVPEGREAVGAERRVLFIGSVVVLLVLAGFVIGPPHGVKEWEVAIGADLVMVALTRRLPWRVIPWGTAVLAGSLAVLADAVALELHVHSLLGGSGPLSYLRQAAVSGVGANIVNNLPALLVGLPAVSSGGGHASCALWPVLWGVNAGPGLLLTGSLASLLWAETMERLGAPVGARGFFRIGLRVVLPSAALGLAVLILLAPAVGC